MFEEYMLKLGYSTNKIKVLKNAYPIKKQSEATLLYNVKNLVNYFKKNGLDNADIINITITVPSIICTSIEDIKLRVKNIMNLGFNRLLTFKLIKNYPYILQLNKEKIESGIDNLLELGFKPTEITKLVINYPTILTYGFSNLKKYIKLFIDYGYTLEYAVFLLSENYNLFDLSINDIKNIISSYEKLGFTNTDIINITNYMPNLFNLSVEEFKNIFIYILDLGFDFNSLCNIIKKVPFITNDAYIEKSKNTIEYFKNTGFSSEEIRIIIDNNLYALFYEVNNIDNKLKLIEGMGFAFKEVIKIVCKCPIIFGFSDDLLSDKINFYLDIDFKEELILNSNILFYNIEIIKARYQYLISNNESIDYLFLDDTNFYKKYNVKTDDIIKYGGDI